jgi:hypothetical protein
MGRAATVREYCQQRLKQLADGTHPQIGLNSLSTANLKNHYKLRLDICISNFAKHRKASVEIKHAYFKPGYGWF